MLVNLVTVDGLEPLLLAPHAEAGLPLCVFVITKVLLILIFCAMLLLVESSSLNARKPICFRELEVLFFIIGLVIVYLIKASSGKSLIFDHGNFGDRVRFFHHANVLRVRVLVVVLRNVLGWSVDNPWLYQ